MHTRMFCGLQKLLGLTQAQRQLAEDLQVDPRAVLQAQEGSQLGGPPSGSASAGLQSLLSSFTARADRGKRHLTMGGSNSRLA